MIVPRHILITGGAGFVGSHVYDAMSCWYPDVRITVLDKMTYAADIRHIAPILERNRHRHRLVVGDVADFETCLAATRQVDLVIHLAAESHVGRSFKHSVDFTRTNALGTHMLMEACRLNAVERIVHVSTDEVYGESGDDPFTEEAPFNPTNPYSASKAAAEMVVRGYVTSYDLPVVTVRGNNLYGIRQFPEKILPRFILRGLHGLPLTLHGDGSHRRHYLSVSDLASALKCVIQHGESGQAYNIASPVELRNLDVAHWINQAIGMPKDHITFTPDRPFNDARYTIDDTKLRALGWQPTRHLLNDLPSMVAWYRQQMSRYELGGILAD